MRHILWRPLGVPPDEAELITIERFVLDEDHGAYTQRSVVTLYLKSRDTYPRFYRKRETGYSTGKVIQWMLGGITA